MGLLWCSAQLQSVPACQRPPIVSSNVVPLAKRHTSFQMTQFCLSEATHCFK
ncbi:hypothetical protein HMPREF9069_00754 [Atopobium sp. oral taxon 810 str. F0209]|nr:hypothetical protein HMPREF9069_00754 [Atopobium sp. oral taxon 810 str. F0209]